MLGLGWMALATDLATPPALVPGDRLVLARSSLPGVGERPAHLVITSGMDGRGVMIWAEDRPFPGTISIGAERELWIYQYDDGRYTAVSGWWGEADGSPRCFAIPRQSGAAVWALSDGCATSARFDAQGTSLDVPRGLDRYLVSVSGERVVVNLSRELPGVTRTASPSPTRR